MNQNTSPIIEVSGLQKRYFLGQNISKNYGLRHLLEDKVRKLFKKNDAANEQANSDSFLAIDDISFSINRGEVVGIIGHNGAGKSTLLKLLSRITEPTSGSIKLSGRVASLLEVGTGFHPELTGKENIYLNGAILGMSRKEINAKFDEIVAFAEVEKFLETPVKRYSSGMYVRLAFAVAAHLEPDILIVDEVLAVGDAAFQKKCLGKMEDVAGDGRTVLFVSHNMPLIANLCQRGILLNKGKITADGPVDEIIQAYNSDISALSSTPLKDRTDRRGTKNILATEIELLDDSNARVNVPMTGQKMKFRLHYTSKIEGPTECRAWIAIRKENTVRFVLSTQMASDEPVYLSGTGFIDFFVEKLPLVEGSYEIDAYLEANELFDAIGAAQTFNVTGADYFGSGSLYPSPHWRNKDVGTLIQHHSNLSPKENL